MVVMDLPREAREVMEELEAEGVGAVAAGGWFHPPARDIDIFMLGWPGKKFFQSLVKGWQLRRRLVLEACRGSTILQLIPTSYSSSWEVLESFDLGASQVGIWEGRVIETEAHERARREARPLVTCVGPTTPSRVLKYREKGFPRYEEDLALAVMSVIRAYVLMGEEFFSGPYDKFSFKLCQHLEGVAPALLAAFLEGHGRACVPWRVFSPPPPPEEVAEWLEAKVPIF